MAVREPATSEEAVERIAELEEELESLDALLVLRERAAATDGGRHSLEGIARELDADDLLGR